MPMKTMLILPGALLCASLAAGCAGDTIVNQGSTTVSKGTELTDLQRAHAEGAISQDEYDALRAKVMRRPN